MIAIRPAAGSNIPNAVIDTAMRRHPDGFGVAWRRDGALYAERFGPKEARAFRVTLKTLDRQGVEYVAHWRLATHGPTDRDHAHPYEYTDPEGDRVLVFHNGVIGVNTAKTESDTEVFVQRVLARLPARWWHEPKLRCVVDQSIGYSKLVIMTADETVSLHPNRGQTIGGIWYSSNPKPDVYTSRPSTYMASKPSVYTPPLLPAPKTAAESAATFGLTMAADPNAGRKWQHAGHRVSRLVSIDRSADGEWQDGVRCDACQTLGDVYVIDGKTYIDLQHLAGVAVQKGA